MESLLAVISRGDSLISETVRKQADELRQSLLGPDPSPLEVLVVRRIVLAWLRLNHVDAGHPEPTGKALATKASCEREFRMALRNLELVRTKLTPASKPAAPEKSLKKKRRKLKVAAGRPSTQRDDSTSPPTRNHRLSAYLSRQS